jgi:hypothetical protein
MQATRVLYDLGQSLWLEVPGNLRDKLGIAISQQAYKIYRDFLETGRWQRLAAHGARPQRLLFASTGTKDSSEDRGAKHRRVRRNCS